MKKRGLSAVVSTLILVALAIATIAIVWFVVNNIVRENTDQSASCFEALGKVKINDEYTCYNRNDNTLQISIDVEDADIEEIRISFSDIQSTKTIDVLSSPQLIDGVEMYGGEQSVKIPDKNSGLTYSINLTKFGVNGVDSAKVAPSVNGKSCEVSDELNRIDSCGVLAD